MATRMVDVGAGDILDRDGSTSAFDPCFGERCWRFLPVAPIGVR